MMFYPIYMPNSSGGGTECVYPSWVNFIVGSGTILVIMGMVAFLICTIAMIITNDDRFDILEKPAIYVFVPMLIGVALVLISLPLLALTGVPIQGE